MHMSSTLVWLQVSFENHRGCLEGTEEKIGTWINYILFTMMHDYYSELKNQDVLQAVTTDTCKATVMTLEIEHLTCY